MCDLLKTAMLSLNVYKDKVDISGYTILYNKTSIQWMTLTEGSNLYIVIRGTDETEDLGHDLDIRRIQTDYGLVHKGMWEGLEEIWEEVSKRIESFYIRKQGNARVILTGHSLGGSIAALIASRFSDSRISTVISVFTYGQPRCGGSNWARFMKEVYGDRYVRVVCLGDIIPYVPFRLRFKHAGKLFFFNSKGVKSDRTFWPTLWETLKLYTVKRRSLLVSKKSHSMDNYHSLVEVHTRSLKEDPSGYNKGLV